MDGLNLKKKLKKYAFIKSAISHPSINILYKRIGGNTEKFNNFQ